MLLAECTVLVLLLVCALVAPRFGAKYFRFVERSLARVARRKRLAVFVVGISALVLRLLLLPVESIPQPGLQDEFSYLLAGDTFAHGRITNPTHPMWIHFETFNVLQNPSYASKFPPGQGLFLAIGEVVFGHPFWGVWLSIGLMSAAICWMLQGWLPGFWALIGSILVILRLGTFSYWANSYWGGTVAAIGGALLMGALARIRYHLPVRHAALMALGLVVLANTRPFEGLVFAIPALVLISVFLRRMWKSPKQRSVIKAVGAFTITLAIGGCLTVLYCWRVTGSFVQMPYQLYQATYDPVPIFIWQSLRPTPIYHNSPMMSLYTGWPVQNYLLARSHPIVVALSKVFVFGFFFLGPTLTLPFIMLGIVLPRGFSFENIRPRTQLLLLVWCLSWSSLLVTVYFSPHYAAPITCVLYALMLIAMQQIRRWHRHKGYGVAIVRAVVLSCALAFMLRAFSSWFNIPVTRAGPGAWYSPNPQVIDRRLVEEKLRRTQGNHLVIVHYNPDHDPFQEWVANDADIDHSKIIWARELTAPENQRLIEYFKDRRVWLLQADEKPVRIFPYDVRAASDKWLEPCEH